ncbi:MAG: ABC transporter permease [Rhodocyclaceae bacterium]|jgi:peptide/nickel transport system permease protein|nr:ABC transporter permease [Rhodocyclaceae bacterium]
MKFVLLWSDALFFLLVVTAIVGGLWARRIEHLRVSWRRVGQSRVAMAAATLLVAFVAVALLDSLHYRERLPGEGENYAVEVRSALDALLAGLRTRTEKTYSAPLATHSFAKETIEGEGRDFPRLKYGGAHLGDELGRHEMDIALRAVQGLALGLIAWLALWLAGAPLRRRATHLAWEAVFATLFALCLVSGVAAALAGGYHVLGTDKVGQDVLYLTLKSIRTGLLIGTLTTLIMLPAALFLGILAGYAGGWVDDVIQYLYTTLNSIPGVLLIAAAVLMMQVVIDTHPDWFATAAERADARLIALCAILGITSWTGLCRLLRGETLKLRELEYVQAARALGVSSLRILTRHILPNVMHIVMIAIVMDFSGLVLAEAVLSYVGIGVDPNTISFGTMINTARMELAREPMVWWSLASAFVFMFALVLAANLFADAVRDAFDPRGAR